MYKQVKYLKQQIKILDRIYFDIVFMDMYFYSIYNRDKFDVLTRNELNLKHNSRVWKFYDK